MWTVVASKLWGGVKAIPAWIWYVFLAIAFGKYIDMRARNAEREKIKAQTKIQQAEVRASVVERTTEIITKERTNADVAIAARDNSPRVSDYDSLPDEFKAIAEGRTGPR